MTNPKANYQSYQEEIDEAILRVLGTGQYVGASEVEAFEEEFAKYCGAKYCVAVANCTDALTLSLVAADLLSKPHGYVAVPSYVVSATIAAIKLAGATPFLIDINPVTLTIDVEELCLAIDRVGIKAVIPVHLFGCPSEINAIKSICKYRAMQIIEDCAHAHGCVYEGKALGTYGDFGCFSFYPTKNLGSLGDAGAVITDDQMLADRLRSLREYGWKERYVTEILGGQNSRMDEIQAAVLRVKLKYLDQEIERRRELASIYWEELFGIGLVLPADKIKHVYHKFTVLAPRRDELAVFLKERGIETTVYYRKPIHLHPAYHDLPRVGSLAVSEVVADQALSLPLWPEMEDNYVREVCSHIKEFYERNK